MNLINKKVFGISLPGQVAQEGLADREGTIIGEEGNQFGEFYRIRWDNGWEELSFKSSIKPASQQNGCGQYYQE